MVGGFEQGAGIGAGGQLRTAGLLPGAELRATIVSLRAAFSMKTSGTRRLEPLLVEA